MSLFSILDKAEYPIVYTLQNIDKTFLDTFFILVSNVPLILIGFSLVIVFLIYKKHSLWKPLMVALAISVGIHFLINEGFFKTLLVEFWIFRPRPHVAHTDIHAIGYAFVDSSFPSSHMAFTTLMVMILSYFRKWFLKYGLIIILIMWLSRIHNGMHYPSDVVTGTLMGVVYGYIGLWLMRRWWLEKKHWWQNFFDNHNIRVKIE